SLVTGRQLARKMHCRLPNAPLAISSLTPARTEIFARRLEAVGLHQAVDTIDDLKGAQRLALDALTIRLQPERALLELAQRVGRAHGKAHQRAVERGLVVRLALGGGVELAAV